MSDFFNYTFDIVNPDAITQNGATGASSYPAVASAVPSIIHAPSSYFYTDVTKVADALPANLTTDAFGPVSGSETTKYRVTSFIRSTTSDLVKVFAISDGQIFIQPQDGDPTRVNLIIKNSSNSYSPLKIKYFIYRGVNKADLIDGVNLKALNTSNPADPNEPELLKRLWKTFLELNPGVTSFPANFIGYDPNQSPETNIEELFCRNIDVLVSKGEHIGNFKDILGLDIVLDYGDYELEHQEVLFKLNLGYARKKEQVFDVSTVSGAVKQKRYKEHIHQFIDAAAFWGSHIKTATINNVETKTIAEIGADVVLKKYQNSDKIYFYVQGENNRSYNYYDSTRKIYGLGTAGLSYDTSGWPILIKSFTNQNLNIGFPLNIDTRINEIERNSSLGIINPHQNIDNYPIVSRPFYNLGYKGQAYSHNISEDYDNLSPITITSASLDSGSVLPVGLSLSNNGIISGTPNTQGIFETKFNIDFTYTDNTGTHNYRDKVSVKFNISPTINFSLLFDLQKTTGITYASFIFFSCNLNQTYPVENYFNNLWTPNIKSSLNIDATINKMYWATYDKSRNINLDDTINASAIIQNKVIFDEGKKTIGTTVTTKKRRLFTALIKNNSNTDEEINAIKVDHVSSGFVRENTDTDNYFFNLFGDINRNFSIYKGTFTDTDTSQIINSLCVFHEESLMKKYAYMFFGITEEEYNKLIFDAIAIPTTPNTHLPNDADNLSFHLEEVTTFASENVRKFKVGIKYEDNIGVINNTTIKFPSAGNEVYVYSIDDLFFFSADFSDYQEYYKEFAKARVEFRPIMNTSIDHDDNPSTPTINLYPNFTPSTNISSNIFNNGEFGFDWLRIGDNGDQPYGNNGVIESGYERYSSNDNDPINTEYRDYLEAYKFLKREYKSLPTQKIDMQYYIPYLNLFSQGYSNRSTNTQKPPFKATLRILVEIDENLSKLEFDYDNRLFSLDKNVLNDRVITSFKESIDKTIEITCLQDFNETKHIKILAYPVGITDKKYAKLAGIIWINKNTNIRTANIALINVITNVNNDVSNESGFYMLKEKNNLNNTLYQVLINPNIIENLTLDLSNDSNFKQNSLGGVNIASGFINEFGRVLNNHTNTGEKIHKYLKRLFNQYPDFFQVFTFDINYQDNSILGHVDEIGKRLVVMYRTGNTSLNAPLNTLGNPRDLTTLNHEVMHGYGLYHTHRESNNVIVEPQKKYIFTHAQNSSLTLNDYLRATDNVMSYSIYAITMWNWQRKFINLK